MCFYSRSWEVFPLRRFQSYFLPCDVLKITKSNYQEIVLETSKWQTHTSAQGFDGVQLNGLNCSKRKCCLTSFSKSVTLPLVGDADEEVGEEIWIMDLTFNRPNLLSCACSFRKSTTRPPLMACLNFKMKYTTTLPQLWKEKLMSMEIKQWETGLIHMLCWS